MLKRIYLLALFLLFLQDTFSQCAMCKAVAEEEFEEQGASGINAGIWYIMIIPYILLFYIFRKKIFGFLKELRNATGNGRT